MNIELPLPSFGMSFEQRVRILISSMKVSDEHETLLCAIAEEADGYSRLCAEYARQEEREACAKLCDQARAAVWPYHDAEVFRVAQTVCENLASRIRGFGV
jgi:hypothetical protein